MGDLTVLSTHAVEDVLRELGPAFERASGVTLRIDYDPFKRRIEDGTAFDVAIVTRPVMDELVGQGKVSGETCTDIARSPRRRGAQRRGQARPGDRRGAFKRALLVAKSVGRHQWFVF